MPFTGAQLAAIHSIEQNAFTTTCLLVGGAGTGKSHTAMEAIKRVAVRTRCSVFVLCAAGAPLEKYRHEFAHNSLHANVHVMTLQSFNGLKPTQVATGRPTRAFIASAKAGGVRFGPVQPATKVWLVVEEAFAASAELVNTAMLSAALLPHSGRSAKNVHLLMIGCPHQMPQVTGMCVFQADVFHDKTRPVRRLVLTENKRCADATFEFKRLLHNLRYWSTLGPEALRDADNELMSLSQRGLPYGQKWIDCVKLVSTNAYAARLNMQEAGLRYRRGEATVVFVGYRGKLSGPETLRMPAADYHTVLWPGTAVVIFPGGIDAVAINDDTDITKIPNSGKIEITQLSTQRGVQLSDKPLGEHLHVRCDEPAFAVVFATYNGKQYRIDAMHGICKTTKKPLHFMPISMMGSIVINRAQGQDIAGPVAILMNDVHLDKLIDHIYTALTRVTSARDAYISGYQPGAIIQAAAHLLKQTNVSATTAREAVKRIDRLELAQIKKTDKQAAHRAAKRRRVIDVSDDDDD